MTDEKTSREATEGPKTLPIPEDAQVRKPELMDLDTKAEAKGGLSNDYGFPDRGSGPAFVVQNNVTNLDFLYER